MPGAAARVRARTHAIAMVDLHGKSLECRAGVCGARLWLWCGGLLLLQASRRPASSKHDTVECPLLVSHGPAYVHC